MEERFIAGDVFVLKGKVKWAAVHEPDTRFEPCWKVDLILSEEVKDELKEAGFNVRQDKDGDWVLTVKSKVTTKAGKKNHPPTVVSRDPKIPFTDAIGNGSECNVKIYAKYIDVAGKRHLPAYLNKIQVLDHVAYLGNEDFRDETSTEVPF